MATLIIDPLTRIEGHQKWTIVTNGTTGNIDDAQCSGTLFRGFENIIAKRDPRDAPQLAQRI